MSQRRYHTADLARLLESAPQPVYVLDDELRIVFANEACRAWLGAGAEGLLGRRCVYHSGMELAGPEEVAAHLCPPPDVLLGQGMAASVARVAEQGLVYRAARFVPFGFSAEEPLGVVAILAPGDAAEPQLPQAAAEKGESLDLHEHVRRFRRQAAFRYDLGQLIGVSPAMRRARAQAELAVGTRASVLLIGPAGSGRRHVAEAIHYAAGPDSIGAILPLECSLLGAELIHTTLQVVTSDEVLRGQAGRGALLLVDADQLPAESQGPMAAAVSAANFPLRILATVTQPLAEAVRRGRYRDDLAALLSTLVIELPPLAQRREDVPLLAQAFLEEINARGGRQLAGFTPEALDRLDTYAWPGNAAELAQVVTESHLRAAGLKITPDDLPERFRLAAEAAARPRRKDETIVLGEFLARIERELIRRALARAKGNKAKAARLLGLNRPRLYRRMQHLGLLEEGEIG
jgi:DNA-binding NtrC family response regulator